MKKFSFIDKEGKEIKCYKWESEGEARGVIQISHGMTEYACRYDYVAKKFSENGFIVYAHDHRGHGETSKSEEERGYIADKEGFDLLVEDVKELSDIIKKENEELPLILFGHSMGSFVSQRYIELYGDKIDGVILSGTNGRPDPITKLGIIISRDEMILRGRKAKSKVMDKLSFGDFNSNFKPNRTDYDWLCADNKQLDEYIADVHRGEDFTVGLFREMLNSMQVACFKKNIEKMSKEMPILLLSGGDDPVGNFGKGVIKTYNKFKQAKIASVDMKIYPGMRHDILHEAKYLEVYNDIVDFINAKIVK